MQRKKTVISLEKLNIIRRILRRKGTINFPLYPGQLHILEFVKTYSGCTQSEVAQNLLITPASVALTKKGEQLSLHCRKVFDEIDNAMLEGFSEEELETFNNFIDRFLANLTKKYSLDVEDMDFFSLYAMSNMIKFNRKRKS